MTNFNHLLENEETLDPNDWEAMRQLGHQMVDDMMDYLQNVRSRPVWQPPSDEAKSLLDKPLPSQPEAISSIYERFKTAVLPFNKGNIHPRFWSWVEGTGSPFAMLSELLAAGMNPNACIGDHSPMYVERQVMDWCKQLLGYPASATGLLVSGASLANITALLVARNSFGERTIRKEGLAAQSAPLVLYASAEAHSCIEKAAEVMGIGSAGVRKVRVNRQFQMDTAHLRQLIADDRAAGFAPFAVVASAGTVNTGAIDPLAEILAICRAESLWMHVDGAFGALAKLTPEFADQLRPIESADSVAFDLHKWMYMPYESGCVLVRNGDLHRAAFGYQAEYLLAHERGLAAGPEPQRHLGMELSRSFKSLKVWMSLQEHGAEKYARLIRQNVAQAFYLESLVKNEPLLELATPVTMNICCFRFNPGGDNSQAELNAMNKELLMRLHERGLAAPSYTMIDGGYYIRVAIVNHRSRKKDFEGLVADVVRLGKEIIL